jgi:hypothetical protein
MANTVVTNVDNEHEEFNTNMTSPNNNTHNEEKVSSPDPFIDGEIFLAHRDWMEMARVME